VRKVVNIANPTVAEVKKEEKLVVEAKPAAAEKPPAAEVKA
jgi:hypothetical protein